MGDALFALVPAVRRAERGRFGFFFGLIGGVTLAQTVGLVGAEAIFLARLGSAALPGAFVSAAAATVLASLLYAVVVGRTRNDALFAAMLAGAALALGAGAFAAWRLLPHAPLGLFCAFFVTQAIFANHFWTFASDYFDTLQAKRLFPLFMAGSSVGGALGGGVAVLLAQEAPPEALIVAWAVGLAASGLALRLARRRVRRWGPLGYEEADETSVASLRAALRYVARAPIARWLVLSALAMVMALFASQYLYSEVFLRAFPDPTALASFLGVLLMASNALELAIELWVTPRLIRRYGVASANLVHPLTTLLAFGALAADFSIVPALLARLNREMLENAIAQPVRSLVANALPHRLRGRMRAFLEGIAVYSGMAIAGAALLALPGGMHDQRQVRTLCALGGALSLLYLAAHWGVRRAYLATLVEELREGRLDLRDVGDALGEFEVARLGALWRELLSRPGSEGGTARAAHELAPLLAAHGMSGHLVFAAGHRDADVRRIAVEALAGAQDADVRAALCGALRDRDAHVREAALRALGDAPLPDPYAGARRELLADPDPDVRAEAASRTGAEGRRALEQMGRSAAPEEAVAALERLPSALQWLARERVHDADAAIAAAALRALARVGAAESLSTEEAADELRRADEGVRMAALAVLGAQRSEAAAGAIGSALDDRSRAVRAAAADALRGLGEVGVAAARPGLASRGVWTVDAALVAIAGSETPSARGVLVEELRGRVRSAWDHFLALEAIADPGDLALRFLRAAHASALGRELRLSFRTLELLESPSVVRSVQRTLRLGPSRARADALEVLSNLGDRQAAGLLALIHESGPVEDRIRGHAGFTDRPRKPDDVREAGRASDDPWIRLAADPGEGAADEETGRHTMERLLALREVPIFAHLRLDQLESIQRAMRDEEYVRGEVIVREGEPGSELYLLLDGEAEVYIEHGRAGQRLVNTIRAIGWFGEMAALDDETRTATVVASKDARLAVLAGEQLKELILAMPEISFDIFRELIARVRRAERRGTGDT